MGKIFRLHTGASENIEHWQDVGSHLHDSYIASINDPSGASAKSQITSIPSPFARMDLVRTAFKTISLKQDLDGNTIYHRMISDCLDVAEIFFNIEALSDKIEILEWNAGIISNGGQLDIEPNSELGKLVNSSNPKHKLLGDTLKMFLFQDQKAFNFAEFKHCYLLNYKVGQGMINIIGGTSPATMFFSSGNDLSFVDISFGNNKMFDNIFCPLYKRGKEFITFIYAFRKSFDGFSEKFPDINTYLEKTFEFLDNDLKLIITNQTITDFDNNYKKIPVNSAGNNVEILGLNLRAKNYSLIPTSNDNDFIIAPSKVVDGLIPCVLPNESFNEPLRYVGGIWQKNYSVPFADEKPMKDRMLPNRTHVKYPYLTVSDFLEPYLIRLPYPIDNTKFFDGNYDIKSGEKDHGFVLPIKKEFFTYFNIEDLQGVMILDGKKMFELQQLGDGIKAILRIPIINNKYIEFGRIYNVNKLQDRIQQADEKSNYGVIVENQITLAIYPFLKLDAGLNPHYRVLLVDRDVAPLTKNFNHSLKFYTQTSSTTVLRPNAIKIRSSKQQAAEVTTAYHILEENFDIIEVANNNYKGLLIPLFTPQPAASKVFKFAIDFGTTNTHIEYKVGNEESKPFDILENDIQVGTLFKPNSSTEDALTKGSLGFMGKNLLDIIKDEFMPFIISNSTQYKFPQRSVVSDNGALNPNEPSYALADISIPFWYLKDRFNFSSEITANLKWGDFENDKMLEKRTEGFFKQLLLMIRNKVLLNGGDLAVTQVVWFYPTSMAKFRRNKLQECWIKYYKRYFPEADKLFKMSESFAPFYYYYHKEGVKPHVRPALNIDIGGGTSDVVVYQSETPVLLTSFKFGANAIFGDGYGSTSAANGFVQRYETKILDALSKTSAQNLAFIYKDLKQKNSNSIELIEFFFSLETNSLLTDNRLPLSFSNMLGKDNEMKLVFILHYSATMYHIAKLMKAKQLQIPDYITFSGNGSKIIKLTDAGLELSVLMAYTKIIFEDVYQVENTGPIEFRFFKKPKEITCKGGLECTDFSRFETIENEIKTVLIGIDGSSTIPLTPLHYTNIQENKTVDAVCEEVNLFLDKFFSWDTKFNFYQNFGINPQYFLDYKLLSKQRIKEDLISGIKEKLQETNGNQNINIEETLFFYPLIGTINRLALNIQKNT